ncbi:MAG: hypothetical protein IJC18_05345 [Clostridia bacterium]|nr:hypothetical protein [Clostridia bacterium]
MKKTLLRALTLMLALLCIVFTLTACMNTPGTTDSAVSSQADVVSDSAADDAVTSQADAVSDAVTVVIATEPPTVYTAPYSELEITEGLISVLDYLKVNSEGFDYTVERSEYGAFITGAGTLLQDTASGTYISIYTSVAADADTSEFGASLDYEGETLTTAAVGASGMTIEPGCTIYIGTVTY